MSAPITRLYFGKREYDLNTSETAAAVLRVAGFSALPHHVSGGDYIVETNAPRAIALNAKRSARAARRVAAEGGAR